MIRKLILAVVILARAAAPVPALARDGGHGFHGAPHFHGGHEFRGGGEFRGGPPRVEGGGRVGRVPRVWVFPFPHQFFAVSALPAPPPSLCRDILGQGAVGPC